jgi:hypothetical protein
VYELSGLSLSSLTGYLAGKRLILVLDNCEHLPVRAVSQASLVPFVSIEPAVELPGPDQP